MDAATKDVARALKKDWRIGSTLFSLLDALQFKAYSFSAHVVLFSVLRVLNEEAPDALCAPGFFRAARAGYT